MLAAGRPMMEALALAVRLANAAAGRRQYPASLRAEALLAAASGREPESDVPGWSLAPGVFGGAADGGGLRHAWGYGHMGDELLLQRLSRCSCNRFQWPILLQQLWQATSDSGGASQQPSACLPVSAEAVTHHTANVQYEVAQSCLRTAICNLKPAWLHELPCTWR